jgi:hypothetical protein
VYRAEIDERCKRLKLWARRKRGNKQMVCSGWGAIAETCARQWRDAVAIATWCPVPLNNLQRECICFERARL